MAEKQTNNEEVLKILDIDPWLSSHKSDIDLRMSRYREVKKALLGEGKSFNDFANGHHFFGFHKTLDGWFYRGMGAKC